MTVLLATASGKGYVRRVRRLTKPLLAILIAAQLLLALPAMASLSSSASAGEVPCDEMPMAGGGDHCPCCLDGADSMKDCLASCTLAVAIVASLQIAHVTTAPAQTFVEPSRMTPCLSDPPLKPPPIG